MNVLFKGGTEIVDFALSCIYLLINIMTPAIYSKTHSRTSCNVCTCHFDCYNIDSHIFMIDLVNFQGVYLVAI